jgi:hypothetical protein
LNTLKKANLKSKFIREVHEITVTLTDEAGLTNEYSFFVTFESEEGEEVEAVEQIEAQSE